MDWEEGERWRPADRAGSALVLLVASLWWTAAAVATAVLSIFLLVSHPASAAEGNDDL